MRLIIITGTCGAGKSTVKDHLAKRLDPDKFVCIDTDEVGINWWDYAGTDHEEHFSDDCLVEAVRLANGHDLVFVSCINPQDYIGRHTIPAEIESTVFIVLCPTDEVIYQRLQARPAERGFTTEEAIRPHIEYNQWFRKNRGKYPLFIDNSEQTEEQTATKVAEFIEGL